MNVYPCSSISYAFPFLPHSPQDLSERLPVSVSPQRGRQFLWCWTGCRINFASFDLKSLSFLLFATPSINPSFKIPDHFPRPLVKAKTHPFAVHHKNVRFPAHSSSFTLRSFAYCLLQSSLTRKGMKNHRKRSGKGGLTVGRERRRERSPKEQEVSFCS